MFGSVRKVIAKCIIIELIASALWACAPSLAEEVVTFVDDASFDDGLDSEERLEDYISALFGLEIPHQPRRMRSSGVTFTGGECMLNEEV